jgi:hypothetical protein
MTDEELALLRSTQEVEIETSRGDGAPLHQTTIWVVVDDRDRVLVRTYQGPASRWYREVLATGSCRLLASGRAISFAVMRADDDERVRACSAELARKYASDPATPAMLRDEVLGTTLELRPA